MNIQKGQAALALVSVFIFGCGIDNGLQNAPLELAASYTILVRVQPPLSLRTRDTRDNWMAPVEAVFHTMFMTSADEGDGHIGHTHKPIDHPPPDIFIGRVETGGFGIVVRAGPADTTWTVGHNGPEVHLPIEGIKHRLQVFLEDATGVRAVPGYSNIPRAGLRLNVTGNGRAEEVELLPVQGSRGFRYEANTSIPLGICDIRIHVTPPTFYRSVEAKDRWMEAFEVSLPGYDVSSGSGNAWSLRPRFWGCSQGTGTMPSMHAGCTWTMRSYRRSRLTGPPRSTSTTSKMIR